MLQASRRTTFSSGLRRRFGPYAAAIAGVITLATAAAAAPRASAARSGPAGYPPSPEAALYRQRQANQRPRVTLLDEIGLMMRPVPAERVRAWKDQLHRSPQGSNAALLEVRLGEYALGHDRDADTALARFGEAERLSPPRTLVHRLAEYDRAIAFFHEGGFADSEAAFAALLKERDTSGAYDRRDCSLWYAHARAHADYHRIRARMGIPEPRRLDPLAGVAALGACLRAQGLPWHKNQVEAVCPHNCLGSTAENLIRAGTRLGAHVRPIQVDDQGLISVPKPIICVVEFDHVIAVTHADRHGVQYLCSDCGEYPGGSVTLDLKRWHALDPTACFAVTRPGTAPDRWLSAVLAGGHSRTPVKVAARGAMAGLLAGTIPALRAAGSIKLLSINPIGGPTQCPACTPELLYGECPGCALHCSTCNGCPFDLNGPANSQASPPSKKVSSAGPSAGDPVNLATGEEEYHPDPDLVVYNPIGPSVVWQRSYESLRTSGAGTGPANDWGTGWSQSFNTGVYDASNGAAGTKYLVEDNGARISFSCTSVPTASNPSVSCNVQAGYPFLITWNYNGTTAGYYTITLGDRTKWTTLNPVNASSFSSNQWCPVGQIADRSSNSIDLLYDSTTSHLTSITDSNGTALLTITRDGSGYITAVSDRYNRSIYYAASNGYYPLVGTVSQVVATGTANPLARYTYTYYTISATPQLHFITVPSPTGTGNSTTTIDYDPTSAEVLDVIDGNNNKHTYSAGSPNQTYVQVAASGGGQSYAYTAGYNSNLSETGRTNGSGSFEYQYTYSDPHDPIRPSLVVDGNSANSTNPAVAQGAVGNLTPTGTDAPAGGATWDVVLKSGNVVLPIASSTSPGGWSVTYATSLSVTVSSSAVVDNNYEARYNTGAGYKSAALDVTTTGGLRKGSVQYSWDQYGNEQSETDSRGTTKSFTYSYTNFALGELTQVKTGSQSPTSFTYYEPSGLIHTVTAPLPGTVGGAQTATSTFSWDGLGNLASAVVPGPGNNTGNQTLTYTLNYTTDGNYTQAEALGEPLTVTDNLGKVYHYRFDQRANQTTYVDPLGNETDQSFNLADDDLTTTFPATGQTGPGHATITNGYQYAGGPLSSITAYDESGTQVRQTTFGYGLEGELLSRSGSAEPVTLQYDGSYRAIQITDGNSHSTQASYNAQGYLATITYPGNTGGNTDKIQFPLWDNRGEWLERVDGNGVETDALFHDADDLLTNINYPATPALNVNVSYDGYSRRQGMSDSTGSVSYSWDDDDDLTQVATTFTGLPQRSISYTLNPDGSRASMVTPAGTFSYLYENDGRLSSLTNPYSETSSWSYLDNGWLQKQTLGNGANANWTYNARGFITRLQNLTSTSATLSDFGGAGGILSDSLGNPTSLPANVPASSAASGTTSYTYNTQDELTQEQSARNGSYTNTFGYDSAFNPTTWKGSTQTFNSDNQNSAFVFDGNGNPTTYGGNTVSWDPENRLTAYGSSLTAGYSGDDLRAWKQSASGRTYFLYDGADPVVEMDGGGNVTAVNTFGAAGLVSRHTSTGSTFYTFDTQGSAVERLDASQNVLSTNVYDAFGKLLSGTASDPWGYDAQDGYFTDIETGMISLSYRYYDPQQGRFLNRDPIGFSGGINLYAYVGNGPLAAIDPSGQQAAAPDPNPDFQAQLNEGGRAAHCMDYNGPHGNNKIYPFSPLGVGPKIRNFWGSDCFDALHAGRSAPENGTCMDDMPYLGNGVGWGTRPSCASHWSRDKDGYLHIINWGPDRLRDPGGKKLYPVFLIRTCSGVRNPEQVDPNYSADHPNQPSRIYSPI